MRILFFNEGNLGSHIMGQGQMDEALRVGLAGTPGVEARFAGLTPMGRWAGAAATRPLPPLARWNLDLRTLRWHLVQSARARAALRRELEAWPADVALVHSQSVALAMGRLMSELPVAVSLDTTIADWSGMPAWRAPQSYAAALLGPSRALERRALTGAAVVLAWTAWARRAAEAEAPRAHVLEHHPGIDLDRYKPVQRTPRPLPRVLFVGGRFAEKGGEDLLAALGAGLGRTVELDIVTPAEVPERPGVRVHRLGPADPRLLQLQQQADLFCLPSHGDAAPWAVLEAMACGTPVIATPVGGIADMLDAGRAGTLVQLGDRAGLAEAIGVLLADEGRRRELAAAARERCEEHFDARRQFARLAEVLAALRPASDLGAAQEDA